VVEAVNELFLNYVVFCLLNYQYGYLFFNVSGYEKVTTHQTDVLYTLTKKKKRINLINWQSLVFSYVYRNVPLDVALYALRTNNVG
jgi:hypothetical protein